MPAECPLNSYAITGTHGNTFARILTLCDISNWSKKKVVAGLIISAIGNTFFDCTHKFTPIFVIGSIDTSTSLDLFENFFFDQSIYRFKFTGIYSLTLN
jgi:hypothetical protein